MLDHELIREAQAIIASAVKLGRDLSDFEAGRCDALIDIAERASPDTTEDAQTSGRQ